MPKMYEAGEATAEQRQQIHAFIAGYKQVVTFLTTIRGNGEPIMRPVAAMVEGWTVTTVTGDDELKTLHIRRNPIVGYLWTALEGRPEAAWSPKHVWMSGRADLIDDPAEIAAFFARRLAAHGEGDAPTPVAWTRMLIRTTPTYLRAEGFLAPDGGRAYLTPVLIRDFTS